MDYKVVSIFPVQKDKETGQYVAQGLEDIIRKYDSEGWENVRVENLMTRVNPVGDCLVLDERRGIIHKIKCLFLENEVSIIVYHKILLTDYPY